jgi:hypothetical protein
VTLTPPACQAGELKANGWGRCSKEGLKKVSAVWQMSQREWSRYSTILSRFELKTFLSDATERILTMPFLMSDLQHDWHDRESRLCLGRHRPVIRSH